MSGTIADTPPPRPSFTNGQYIGADDLNAAVDYARDETRRLALSGRTWGIAGGLDLVEIPDATGATQMWIEPGMAWDGYGRPIILASPVPVTADLFAGLLSGNQPVWLYYQAVATDQVQAGFQVCGAGDPTTRVNETFGIATGNPTIQQRSAGVIINGVTVTDPRTMLIAVDQNAAIVLDGSVPYQAFPDDTAQWLVPIGIVSYTAGSPGSFNARTPTQLALNRTIRRYADTVAESVLAADGVLRLRDRQTDFLTNLGTLIDNYASAYAIQPSDLEVDPNNASRLIGDELVWVEGNMRVLGDERMWGGMVELRDPTGAIAGGAPEYFQRGGTLNALGGQDLQVAFGATSGTPGQDRIVFGIVDSPGTVDTCVVFRTDSRAAIGTDVIDNYNTAANNLVVASNSDTGITVASNPANTGNLYFANGTAPASQKAGFVSYDHVQQQMTIGAGSNGVMTLTAGGQVAIGPVDGTLLASDACQFAIANPDGGGVTMLLEGQQGTYAEIAFANGTTAPHAGAIEYNLSSNTMSFLTNGNANVFIDPNGQLGIGTGSPGAPIDIHDPGSSQDLHLRSNAVQARTSGNPSALLLQNAGGAVGVGVSPPGATMHIRTGGGASLLVEQGSGGSVQTSIRATGGSVSIGSPNDPRTVLDVRGAIAQSDFTEVHHVAVIENQATAPSNVLALKAQLPEVYTGTFSNYITFLDGNDNIAASIEAYTILGLSNATFFTGQSADYAEAVPRAPGTPQIGANRIVGVSNGVVSLNTDGADALFVTTPHPSVVGASPPRAKRADYEMLAFLGQVSITVEGPVSPGDLIVPSGNNDGIGRAIPPAQIQPADMPRVVGRAWASSSGAKQALVNALVGPGVAAAAASSVPLTQHAAAIQALTDAGTRAAAEAQGLTDLTTRQGNAIQGLTDLTTRQGSELQGLTDLTTRQSSELQALTDLTTRQGSELQGLTDLTTRQGASVDSLAEQVKRLSADVKRLTDSGARQQKEIKDLVQATGHQAAEIHHLTELAARQAAEIRRLHDLILGTPPKG